MAVPLAAAVKRLEGAEEEAPKPEVVHARKGIEAYIAEISGVLTDEVKEYEDMKLELDMFRNKLRMVSLGSHTNLEKLNRIEAKLAENEAKYAEKCEAVVATLRECLDRAPQYVDAACVMHWTVMASAVKWIAPTFDPLAKVADANLKLLANLEIKEKTDA
mmetsp:Transcript_17438/g.46500  ORF Transcript_17438/g.46500 Transcript_17438/m.46500 type:complete len:161 (-) Transcript_17438:206-688(-)